MPVGLCGAYLTNGGRRILCIFILVFNIISVILCIVLVIRMLEISQIMPSSTELVPSFDSWIIPICTTILACLRITLGIAASKTWSEVVSNQMCVQEAIKRWVTPVFIGHVILCILCFIFGLLVLFHSFVKETLPLSENITEELFKYRTHHSLKVDIDWMQINFECCGGNNWEDWFDIEWMEDKYLIELSGKEGLEGSDGSGSRLMLFKGRDETIKRNKTKKKTGHVGGGGGGLSAPLIFKKAIQIPQKIIEKRTKQKEPRHGEEPYDQVPFSCCNMWSERPCIHNYVKNYSSTINRNYRYSADLTLHRDGCGDKLDRFIMEMLRFIYLILFSLFLLELLQKLLARIVQVSYLDALNACKTDVEDKGYYDVGYGYLFNVG